MSNLVRQRRRFPLIEHTTPIQRIVRLEQAVGATDCPPIYVKRDDLMGICGGGNKLSLSS